MNISVDSIIIAFGLTLFAGLATSVGGLLGLFAKENNKKFLSISLGFSAGVMLYVSFVEIFNKARLSLVGVYGNVKGNWITVMAFFGGIFLIAIIDNLIPECHNPHNIKEKSDFEEEKKSLHRMGLITALAISIHNFPEGLATFTAALKDPSLGVAIAIAIAIHNIPEGISVSVPVLFATGSRKRAFLYTFISGIAEPLGAIVGYLLLMPFFNDTIFGVLFAIVGGIMVFISLDELLPTAEKYGEHHLAIYSMIGGMMVMAISLLLFI